MEETATRLRRNESSRPLIITVNSGVLAVLQVWGAWAITAGVVQLVVAINRRSLGVLGGVFFLISAL